MKDEFVVNFSQDWNGKLKNNIFHTIRCFDSTKLNYYTEGVGKPFTVKLTGKNNCRAILREVTLLRFGDIPENILRTDTGYYDIEKIIRIFNKFKIYRNSAVIFLLFERLGNGQKY